MSEMGDRAKQFVHWSLLELALEKSGRPFDLDISEMGAAPGRSNRIMREMGDDANIQWHGVGDVGEKGLLPVKIPLFRGLQSYWPLWVNSKDLDKFENLRTVDDLNDFVLLQGQNWHTIAAFERVGCEVVTGRFLNLPKMLSHNRADILPYTVIEARGMFGDHPEEMGLTPLEHVMVYMPTVMYFFVSPDNQELHDALYEGLLKSFEDGSYVQLLRTHPGTKDAFADIDLENMHVIHIEADNLDNGTWEILDHFRIEPAEVYGDISAQTNLPQ
ncbi:hypothetical protein [Paracoccus sp. (in: a-proteobacteria)]|uniref:hypothetical protein n=1 Tax=Paracoccus sp. TaxID=267 RepID=UPI003A86318E